MIFKQTPLANAFVIEPERRGDSRGYFTRTFCINEFADAGLATDLKQGNAAFNSSKGITRGMHYQIDPCAETKLVRCTRGTVFDVIVDVREESATQYQWFGIELSAQNGIQLYVPEGFAHGYQVLEDNSEISYLVSEFYSPESERGIRWDDPHVGIKWPISNDVELSEKDKAWDLL